MKSRWRWMVIGMAALVLVGTGILRAPDVDAQTPLTPTPSTTNIFRIANEITQPQVGDAVSGWVSLEGTAVIEGFRQYQVHISPAGMESWRWLYSSARVIRGGQLYLMDSTLLPDGFYDVRVRAIQDGGQYSEAFLRGMEIRNANPPTATPAFDALGTPIPPTATPTATPTAIPAPDVSVRFPNGQGFYAPLPGSILRGYVPIIATVNGTDRQYFDRYELYLSTAGDEAWTWLFTSADQIWQDAIYVFNTFVLPDGAYDLRLRVVYRDSNYNEYHLRNLFIANQGAAPPVDTSTPRPVAESITTALNISSPHSYATLGAQVDVRGTATHPNFQRWELHWAPSDTEKWSLLTQGDRQRVDSLLAQLDMSAVRPGRYDLRLRVVRRDGNYSEIFVRGLTVPGHGAVAL